MRARSRLRAAQSLLACLVAVIAGGCGGGSDDPPTNAEYGAELRRAMADLEEAYGVAGAAGNDPSPGSSAAVSVARLHRSQVALRDAADRLDEIEASSGLADEHDDLVAGVRDMAHAVDLLIDAEQLADTDPAQAKRLAREFGSDDSFARVSRAAGRIADAGVDTGL